MAITREQIVTEARRFLGARWQHQARTREAVDCVGLIEMIGRAVGYSFVPVAGYSRTPDGATLEAALNQNLDVLPDWRDALPGDFLTMKYNAAVANHVLIVTAHEGNEWSVVHAKADDKVVEHRLDASWLRRIVGAYRVRGIIA